MQGFFDFLPFVGGGPSWGDFPPPGGGGYGYRTPPGGGNFPPPPGGGSSQFQPISSLPSQDLPGGDNFDWDDPSDWASLVEKIGPTAFCFAYPSRCEGGIEGSPDPSRFPGAGKGDGNGDGDENRAPWNQAPRGQGQQQAGFVPPGGWGPWAVGGAAVLALVLANQDGDASAPAVPRYIPPPGARRAPSPSAQASAR
jgi:hypothetical protein